MFWNIKKIIAFTTFLVGSVSSFDKQYELWNAEAFSESSYVYNDTIAKLSVMLSEASYDISNIKALLKNEWEFDDIKLYNYKDSEAEYLDYDGTNCFTVAHKNTKISGSDTTILVVAVRGTQELISEGLGDLSKYDWISGLIKGELGKEVLNYYVFDHIYDYYTQIEKGVNFYFLDHAELKKVRHMKILITGHSLGGAAANLYAAKLLNDIKNKNFTNKNLRKEDVFTYTFGAIKVIDCNTHTNVKIGYENIFNIYNKYDSFGPNGNFSHLSASSPYQKFGKSLVYDDDWLHAEEFFISWNNHDIKNYNRALNMLDFSKIDKQDDNNKNTKLAKNTEQKQYEINKVEGVNQNNSNSNEPNEYKEYNINDIDCYDLFEMSDEEVDDLKEKFNVETMIENGSIFLEKNNKKYSLMRYISETKAKKYGIGYYTNIMFDKSSHVYTRTVCSVYKSYFTPNALLYNHSELYSSVGKIPIMKVKTTDKVIGYSKRELYLAPVVLSGYTIKAGHHSYLDDYIYGINTMSNEYIAFSLRNVSEFTMKDSSGNVVSSKEKNGYDFQDISVDLKEDEIYTISWFEGANYKEYEVIADSYVYRINWLKENSGNEKEGFTYQIDGKLDKESHATFDLSQIPKGLYYMDTGCIIEIS